jgi:hypothetical protein
VLERPLRYSRDVIEQERRLELQRDVRNPPQPSVRDHDERPSGTTLLDVPSIRDVLASSDREDVFVGV